MKYTGRLLAVLALVLSLVLVLGCDAIDDITGAIDEVVPGTPAVDPGAPAVDPGADEKPEPPADGMKTITVYPQDGITNPTVNGVPIITGQDNELRIDPDQPLQMKYDFVNSRGQQSQATHDLQTYYDFHVLKANGGWASTLFRDAYETDKSSQ